MCLSLLSSSLLSSSLLLCPWGVASFILVWVEWLSCFHLQYSCKVCISNVDYAYFHLIQPSPEYSCRRQKSNFSFGQRCDASEGCCTTDATCKNTYDLLNMNIASHRIGLFHLHRALCASLRFYVRLFACDRHDDDDWGSNMHSAKKKVSNAKTNTFVFVDFPPCESFFV